jgi:DNA-binding NarL/FixJ family response regulator
MTKRRAKTPRRAPLVSLPPKPDDALPRRARIGLVDDHPMLRSGMAHLINAQADMVVSFDSGDATAALDQMTRDCPDLVVTDLTMPGRSGIELLKEVKARFPAVPVLVLSMHDEAIYAERAIRAGAAGYVMKNLGGEQLLQAIRRILSGQRFLSDQVYAQLVDNLNHRHSRRHNSPIDKLTDREFEILELIGQGKNTHEIAAQLQISPKTVDVHRVRLRTKLELRDGTALIRYALRWAEVMNV